jgi:hypothetical protein
LACISTVTSGKSKVGLRLGGGEGEMLGVRVIVGVLEAVGERVRLGVGAPVSVAAGGWGVSEARSLGLGEAAATNFVAIAVGEGTS